jgi:hypothetical protein
VASVALAPAAAAPATQAPAASSPAKDGDGEPVVAVTAAELRADVQWLAADARAGRATPSAGLDAAAEHIASRFAELGLSSPPDLSAYRQTFECGGRLRPGPASNVVAIAPGRDASAGAVLVTAHYDHVGTRPGEADPVFNGANDNASGVAAMLAVAGVVSHLPSAPRRSVVFVAFCGEELGLRGSKYFAAHPPVALETVVAAVNLEMLGRATADHPDRVWVTGADLSTLRSTFSAANLDAPLRFVSSVEVGPVEADVFDRSDNFPLAERGVVAHTFSTGRLDAYYHAAHDEADSLDYEAMATIVQGMARGVLALADTDDPPQWTAAGHQAGY